ncbi:TetR/AcrR family transcriptional regulator [Bosea vaviloviae]|uniref:TetR/AcrR family transcriptional regulator n=1 Tax=Bosea vaviloviae TaxID=1526658 RepID=UPI000AA26E5A|nr:TetR/AcrR family transcriptional regulator [Bosea vaviloviae]
MEPTDTRTAILEVAARLYADLGYSAVSMRDVAKEIGVTPANLYHHFKGKEDLIRETLAHVFAQKTAPLADIFTRTAASSGQLEVFVDFFLRLLLEDRVFFRLLVRELLDGGGSRLRELAHSVLESPFSLVSSLADQQGSEDQRFLTTVSMIGIILGHVQLAALLPYLPGGRPDYGDPSILGQHISAVLRRAFHDAEKEK